MLRVGASRTGRQVRAAARQAGGRIRRDRCGPSARTRPAAHRNRSRPDPPADELLGEVVMRGWGPSHDVHAELLRELLLRGGLGCDALDPRGMRLRGVRIRGGSTSTSSTPRWRRGSTTACSSTAPPLSRPICRCSP